MRKKSIALALCMGMLLSLLSGCGNSLESGSQNKADLEETKQEQQEIQLPSKEAVITGQGIDLESNSADTVYSSDLDSVINFGSNSTITYTVPEDTEGEYDIYIEYGKSLYPFGTVQARLVVNGKDEYVIPADVEGCKEDFSDLYSKGKFLMAENINLKSGDTLEVKGKPGFESEFNGTKISTMTSVGDMYLYSAGTEVSTGYDPETVKEQEKADPNDPLSGLNIVWLGSSVTYGMMSGGYSMADLIEDNHNATNCYKYAISGTTLVNDDSSSYVERLKGVSPDMKIDLLVVQLSTNDATEKKPLGTISDSKNMTEFDDTTISGAIESIIAYAEQTWNCPIVFYTGTYFESPEYSAMVDTLLQIQKKWDIGVIDLWNNKEMTALYGTEKYKEYMADDVHPTLEGYTEWWSPVFEEYLSEYMALIFQVSE